jgi:hypothetical protein
LIWVYPGQRCFLISESEQEPGSWRLLTLADGDATER